MEVGFLGTGRMGKAMAANLLKAGHRVRAWDKSSEPLHELKRAGADIATNAADAFRGDAVVSILPNDQALREVFIEGDLLKCSDGPRWRRPPSSASWRPEIQQRSTACSRCSMPWAKRLIASGRSHGTPTSPRSLEI